MLSSIFFICSLSLGSAHPCQGCSELPVFDVVVASEAWLLTVIPRSHILFLFLWGSESLLQDKSRHGKYRIVYPLHYA